MSQTITPNLWFERDIEESISSYVALFDPVAPGGAEVTATSRYPTEGLLDFQEPMSGSVLTMDFRLGDTAFTAINGGPAFRPNASISFGVALAERADVDQVWAALSDGGHVLMDLGEYPFNPYYGWVEDRNGFSWQLSLAAADAGPRPFVVPSLLFAGDAVGQAGAALRHYVDVLGGEVGVQAPYPEPSGPAAAGDLMYADALLGDSLVSAMDSGVEMDAPFTEAVSFSVSCHGQEELDRVWAGLSRVPEAEQCGWCRDEFGVSWQVVPANLGELMQRPDAYAKLMAMHKIVIADF
ncbi:VOC family protein [Aeromicrobium alkaliterrae]|uniref:VOC family protein n=1 Tax=Aeromicrobium alkaliterrae TaxID=302168 RepID=A0ABN2JFM8_9ACTN